MGETQACTGCGAQIDTSEIECPYCGHKVVLRTVSIRRATPTKGIRVERDGDGLSYVQFGDGEDGKRPSSGRDSVRATYSYGGGRASTKMALVTCPKCKLVQKQDQKSCSRCGSKLKS